MCRTLLIFGFLLAGSTAEWRPIENLSHGSRATSSRLFDRGADKCNLYKVVMHQDGYREYIQYKAHLPDLKEFTLCTWHKIYNHSVDHPLFSYSVKDQPREIVSWISNDDRSSFYQMAIGGHTIYRLGYPMKKFKWYHSCQSWNGRTGEWQLWVDAERVGRGFYNLIVGKKIRGGGTAITGQDQKTLSGGFGISHNSRAIEGLIGEVTLIHLYKAALTAGKAYNNHKHHHVHKFQHEGAEEPEQPAPPPPPPQPLPYSGSQVPFLMNMQLVRRLPVEQLNVLRQQQEFLRMQQQMQQDALQQFQQFQSDEVGAAGDYLSGSGSPGPFSSQTVRLFKRDNTNSTGAPLKRERRSDNSEEMASTEGGDSTKQKRTAGEFGVFPGADLSELYQGDGFVLGGGFIPNDDVGFNSDQSSASNENEEEDKAPRKWSEPAEWEVRSIMSLCSGCGEDPFRKANVLSWRETSKKLYAGALYVPAAQQCHQF